MRHRRHLQRSICTRPTDRPYAGMRPTPPVRHGFRVITLEHRPAEPSANSSIPCGSRRKPRWRCPQPSCEIRRRPDWFAANAGSWLRRTFDAACCDARLEGRGRARCRALDDRPVVHAEPTAVPWAGDRGVLESAFVQRAAAVSTPIGQRDHLLAAPNEHDRNAAGVGLDQLVSRDVGLGRHVRPILGRMLERFVSTPTPSP